MSPIKTIIDVPWLRNEYANQSNRINNTQTAYEKVPLIYRALRLRCDGLNRVPLYFYNEQDDVVDYPFQEQMAFQKLLWLNEAALLLKGASFNLIQKNVYQLQNLIDGSKGLEWLNPFFVYIEELRNGDLSFYQMLSDGRRNPSNRNWTKEEILYLREFHPLDEVNPGVSAAALALGSSQISGAVTNFLSDFFSADALPVTLITMPAGTGDPERDRVETWFKKKVNGMRKAAARVLGVTKDVKVEKLTSDLSTFDFDKVDTHAEQGVSDAFGIPMSILRSDSGANRSISDNDRRSYLNDTLIPRTKFFEDAFNPFFKNLGVRLEFVPEELPEMQEDESTRAQSLNDLIGAGVPLLAALDILGYDLSDDTRLIIEESVKQKQERAQQITDQQPTDPNQQMKDELNRMMRKSLNRIKAGKSAVIDFETSLVPPEILTQIKEMLAKANDESQVKAVFTVYSQNIKHRDMSTEKKNLDYADFVKAIQDMPAPIVNVNVPQTKPPDVNITVPTQIVPEVKINVPDIRLDIPAAIVNVSVPEQLPPKVVVNVPEQRAPIVNVEIPSTKKKIIRNSQGMITEIKEELP